MKLVMNICLVALVVLVGSGDAVAVGSSRVTNYETKGNLAATAEVGCAKSAKLVNTNTPVDMYRGLAVCIKAGNYQDGAFLFAMAGAYGRFDTLRVADRTAHQAMTVMKMGVLGGLDATRRDEFSAEVQKTIGNPDNLREACNEIKRIGAPAYHPDYMIDHGIKAFTGDVGRNGLVEDFDAKSAWLKVLDSYLHCPEK